MQVICLFIDAPAFFARFFPCLKFTALAGKVLLVIGGTTGLGLSAARAFLDAGARGVVVTGRNPASANAALAPRIRPRREWRCLSAGPRGGGLNEFLRALLPAVIATASEGEAGGNPGVTVGAPTT